jgi:membrane protease YdiL (CAAX protease family)
MTDRRIPATTVGLCVALLGPVGLAILSKKFLPDPPNLAMSILAELVLVSVCAMVLAIVIFWERRTLSSIGLKPLSLRSIAWGGVFAAFLIWAYSPFLGWVMALARIPWFTEGAAKLTAYPVWYLTLIIIIGGTAEELLHRGYLIERLAGLTGSYFIAGLASVFINALSHVPVWGWWTSLTFVLSGAVTTAFYLWRRDLLANIIAHVVTDFAGLVVPILMAGK